MQNLYFSKSQRMEIGNTSPLELVKFLQFEMNHINLQLLMTMVILALEVASLESASKDPTLFDASGVSKWKTRLRINIWPPNLALQSYLTLICPSWADLRMEWRRECGITNFCFGRITLSWKIRSFCKTK